MDPETARQLFDGGAMVVFLDVPPNTEVGIDMNVWRTGDKFKGLKMVPPGLHLLYYSAVGKDGVAAPRTGWFHVFRPQEVVLLRWDAATETVVQRSDPNTLDRIRLNKQELDRFLGAFPYDTWKRWYALTSHISEEVAQRLMPACGLLSAAAELVPHDASQPPQPAAAVASAAGDNLLPKMHARPGTEVRFTALPSVVSLRHTPAERRTQLALDGSQRLHSLVQSMADPQQVLGELQFAFVAFLVGHVYDAFEHWRALLQLLCSCDAALRRHPQLFQQLLSCMHFQIQEVSDDIFTDIMSRENFLVSALHVFFSNLEDESVPAALRQKGEQFRAHWSRALDVDFSQEPDEFAPVVVDTT